VIEGAAAGGKAGFGDLGGDFDAIAGSPLLKNMADYFFVLVDSQPRPCCIAIASSGVKRCVGH
jgi:hypothetical protein